jgi:hypothetical protein
VEKKLTQHKSDVFKENDKNQANYELLLGITAETAET